MRQTSSLIRAALALLLPATCASALAQEGDLSQRRDAAARELVAAQARATELAARAREAGSIDRTPPVLHSIDVTGSVNAQQPDQFASVQFDLTDDLSGVVYYYVEFRSPGGGHYIVRSKTVPYPTTHVSGTLTFGSYPYSYPEFGKYDQPGTWVATFFYAYDANGNQVSLGESQLAALGPQTFALVNNGGYDVTPPLFDSGAIATPTVKLSKPPKGTPAGTPPYVSADITVTDQGNGAISGLYEAILILCLPNGTGGCRDTMTLDGLTNKTGLLSNTVITGTQLRAHQVPGQYQVYSLELRDVADNDEVLLSSAFGGDTNFHNYFPQGITIFVNQ